MNSKYREILYLPRPVSNHPPMSRKDRASQFAPFAALEGYKESLQEVDRITEEERILSEDSQIEVKQFLDELITKIPVNRRKSNNFPTVSLTYFIPDELKSGGQYQTKTFTIKKYDEVTRCLVSMDNEKIKINNIVEGFFLDTNYIE